MVDGQVVMLELDSDHYYRLDAAGSRMWELLSTGGDVDAAYARLLESGTRSGADRSGDTAATLARSRADQG